MPPENTQSNSLPECRCKRAHSALLQQEAKARRDAAIVEESKRNVEKSGKEGLAEFTMALAGFM